MLVIGAFELASTPQSPIPVRHDDLAALSAVKTWWLCELLFRASSIAIDATTVLRFQTEFFRSLTLRLLSSIYMWNHSAPSYSSSERFTMTLN